MENIIIGIEYADGTCKSIACFHNPASTKTILKTNYVTHEQVHELMLMGDISFLGVTPSTTTPVHGVEWDNCRPLYFGSYHDMMTYHATATMITLRSTSEWQNYQ